MKKEIGKKTRINVKYSSTNEIDIKEALERLIKIHKEK